MYDSVALKYFHLRRSLLLWLFVCSKDIVKKRINERNGIECMSWWDCDWHWGPDWDPNWDSAVVRWDDDDRFFFLHQSRMNRIFHSFMKFNQLFGGFIYNAVHLQIIFEPFQCGYLLHTHTIRSVMLWIYSLIEYNGNNENQS